MLEIEFTTAMKRDLKKYKHQKEVLHDLQQVISLLTEKKNLPTKHKDHHLTGNWHTHRECHTRNDILLIYKIEDNILFLSRFGSHSELF